MAFWNECPVRMKIIVDDHPSEQVQNFLAVFLLIAVFLLDGCVLN